MTDCLRVAIAQLNPTMGDLAGNLALVRKARAEAAAQHADLVVTTELVMTGYPPEDLVLRQAFQDDAAQAVRDLASDTRDSGPAIIVGVPWRVDGGLHNAALLLADGDVAAQVNKFDLPNYGVFDEKRVFTPGSVPVPVEWRGHRLGVMVCEDMWTPVPAKALASAGAEQLIVINGSPYEHDKSDERLALARERVRETGLPLIYANQIGGQDEIVFDGASFVVNADGAVATRLSSWREAVAVTEWEINASSGWTCVAGNVCDVADGLEGVYQAMVTGLRDYVQKNRFPGVVLGLSGGIDSALSAAVAVDALGAENVRCVMMPSVFTSRESLDDAAECASLLGAQLDDVPIVPAIEACDGMLARLFEGKGPDITEENVQARMRGVLLMAVSNKFGHMVLTTGNKSEMSVGYATLYGDMCGGYSVLKDVYKTTVFALSRWRNQHVPEGSLGPSGRVIPENIIVKPPTAELRLDQKDEDSLPPYDVLDDILRCLVEEEMAFDKIVARGHPVDVVARVENLLYIAEYKRRQAPPGVKITRKNFGRDRRYPITNRYRDAQ
ncbi:MAG: NAD+ synthase [Alphaproteobacteria bacterium]|nr:NAD+ synthase [Alphaproteobacteria bacterium]